MEKKNKKQILQRVLFISELILVCSLFGLPKRAMANPGDMDNNGVIQQRGIEVPSSNSLKRNLTISSFVELPSHSFLISTGAGRVDQRQVNQRIQYNPTFGPNIGIRGNYDFWTLSLSKRLSFVHQQDVQTYGRSDYDDWRIGYNFTKTFLVELYYKNYHGFYTDLGGQEGFQTSFGSGDNQNFSNIGTQSQIINRPDISSLNYGLRGTYVLPLTPILKMFSSRLENESMNWDFNFLAKAYYNRLRISGEKPLIPSSSVNSFSPISSLKENGSNTLGLGAGLGVIVPMSKQAVFGFDAQLGTGFQKQSNLFTDHESVAYTTAEEMNANLYMDWKGDKHGFRFDFYLDTLSSKVDDINFDTSNFGLNLSYTYSYHDT